MSALIHIVRKGSPIGQFRREQIPGLLDTGRLLPDDEVFLPADRKWIPLDTFLDDTPPPPSSTSPAQATSDDPGEPDDEPTPVEEESLDEDSSHSSRKSRSGSRRSSRRDPKKRHKRNPLEIALPGWIAALFALVIASAFWFWGHNLAQQLVTAADRERALKENIATYEAKISALMESIPPGRASGILTLEPTPGRLAVVSGASVGIFPRADIEKLIAEFADSPVPVTDVEFNAALNRLERALPSPADLTVTDSNGRFELRPPVPGDYVVFTTATKTAEGRNSRLIWLQSVRIDELPSQLVPLSEKNSIRIDKPGLRISPPRI